MSALLQEAISYVSDLVNEGADISTIVKDTADIMAAGIEEASEIIVYLEDLVNEESELLDAAILVYYEDIESGLTYIEAMDDNTDLAYAVTVSSELETALHDLYNAIVDGDTFDEAMELYEDSINDAIADAIYLVVDETVQEIEESIAIE